MCLMPFTDVTVYPDGTVGLCCSDALEKTDLGNLQMLTLNEIWTSETYKLLRETVGQDRTLYPFCKGCDFIDAGIRNEFIKERIQKSKACDNSV